MKEAGPPGKTRGRKKKFTPKQVQRMREMKAEGLPILEIANLMGVGASTVSAYLRGDR